MVALFGRYEYLHELGRGSSGRVFAVSDLADDGALRAIKVLSGAAAPRLVWEFARLSRIEHEGVARVRELLRVEQPEHAPFRLSPGSLLLVEDLVEGQPFSRFGQTERSFGEREAFAIQVGLGVASALAAIHAAGLVHGDVKPDNIMIDAAGVRPVLIDLGFCEPPGFRERPSGTPRYMAPELLAGLSSPASDVYALGGTLFDWLLGDVSEHSSSRGGGALFARRMERLRELGAGELADVLASFLQAEPGLRPGDARAAYQALVPVAQAKGVLSRADPALFTAVATGAQRAARARALPFVGRAEALAELEAQLGRGGAVLVAGARGAGRSRLVREALRRLTQARAESAAALPTIVRTLDGLERVRGVPALLWLAPVQADLERELAAALKVQALRAEPLALVVECDPLFQRPGLARIEIGPLPRAEFEQLLAALIAPDACLPAVVDAAYEAAQGMAGRLCELAADALAAQRDLADARSFVAARDEQELFLGRAAGRLAELFAWAGAGLSPAEGQALLGSQPALDEALAELWARGLLLVRGQHVGLTSGAARQLRARSYDRRAAIVAHRPAAAGEGAFALFARGELARAEQAFVHEAQELRRAGRVAAAVQLLREAVLLLPREMLCWWLADSERAQADYAAAAQTLEGRAAPAARLLLAEVARLRGERARAEELATTLAAAQVDPAIRERASALCARLAFDRGALSDARAQADALLEGSDPGAVLRAMEVRLLVELSQGLPAPAQADALVEKASAVADARLLGRALSLRAQLRARHGDQARALADATRALELAHKAGEAHERASYAVNLGLLQMEAGELGLAGASLEQAAFALSRIDRPADLARVIYNMALLSLCIGDDARARALIAAGARFAGQADAAVRAFLRMLSAEIALRQGQLEAAARELDQALEQLPSELSPARAVLCARAALAHLLCGRNDRAGELLALGRAACPASDVSAQLELAVAEIRCLAGAGDNDAAERVAQAGMQRISGQTPFAERLRFLLAAIEAARGAEQEGALRERTQLCRALLEAALSGLAPAQRALMRARPEYGRVLSAAPSSREARSTSPERWRRLVQSARRLFAGGPRARIASQLVELALELVHAERALLVACTNQGTFELRARAELAVGPGALPLFSRSVVQRVWSEGKSLLTIEASRDLRLSAAQSIHALSVRSVIAVPVEGFGEPVVLYLDDRLRAEAFGSDDLEILEDLAALAREALRAALARTREARRARKAEQEASALSLALAQAPAGTGGRGSNLIGTSAALLSVIDSARRVARSEVSVLITGDSGTGKELLARLLHDESSRRAQPFVAENCAALPDTLLESALFGHVRGAFTGADKNRRGLFEAADKGTLFLDEVGEMSPALQAKLLRVLQEGELRPLGSERTRRVDVRVIAATRRDLTARVREGAFREDLFYRLAVVTLELPPLSVRREDIPLLVRHFVTKHQGARVVHVSSAALRALCMRDYPGNVRQLENDVRRALALCEHDRIELADVPALPTPAVAESAELDLHAQLNALSDKLVAEALARSAGNVTQAAVLLGLSRFGLQKILKRSKSGRLQRK